MEIALYATCLSMNHSTLDYLVVLKIPYPEMTPKLHHRKVQNIFNI